MTDSRSLKDLLRTGRPLVVGHRGASGYRPENTLASFAHALALGADLIEFDVHLTRDGVPVVIHDDHVDRTTDGHGLVSAMTADEIARLDAGTWYGAEWAGQRVSTLDQVLAWARDHGTMVDIEIKNGPIYHRGIEQSVVGALDRAGMTARAIVISFDHPAVARVHALDPRVATGILYAARPVDAVEMARRAGAGALLPHWAYVTPDDLAAAHAAGLAVAPWVSSDPDVLRRLVAAGVDAIGTNHPDVLRRIVDE